MWDASINQVRHFFVSFSIFYLFVEHVVSMLDDGLTVGWSQTQRDLPFEKRKVYADNLAVRSWALAHQAGTLTYPHHDADGDVTYIIGMFGVKLWTFDFALDPTLSREELQAIAEDLCNPDVRQHPRIHAETVYLYLGDLVFISFVFSLSLKLLH